MVGSLILSGCSNYTSPPSNQNTTQAVTQPANEILVKISNMAFDPASVTVKAGETVTWENEDGVAHQIKADSFNSDPLHKGQRFSFTFPKAGTYTYICNLHPSMKGTVNVK